MNRSTTSLPPQVLDAIRSGRTTDATRLLRATGMDLKSARELIDAHARGAAASVSYTQSPGAAKTVPASVVEALQQDATPGGRESLSPGEEPRAGHAGSWLMLAVFAFVGWYLMR